MIHVVLIVMNDHRIIKYFYSFSATSAPAMNPIKRIPQNINPQNGILLPLRNFISTSKAIVIAKILLLFFLKF